MTKPTTPDQSALSTLADLFLVPPDERAPEPERYEQLRQAWKEYREAEPVEGEKR